MYKLGSTHMTVTVVTEKDNYFSGSVTTNIDVKYAREEGINIFIA